MDSTENQRLKALHSYEILDTAPEKEFDDATHVAAQVSGTPMALISLIDESRQWFKAKVGIGVNETPRAVAFCDRTIGGSEIFIINDASQDPRFSQNPLVTGPMHIRFYAGIPLINPEGHAVGAFCVMDTVPRQLNDEVTATLHALARQVMTQLELRRTANELRATVAQCNRYQQALTESERFATSTVDALTAHIAILDEKGKIISVNAAWRSFAEKYEGWSRRGFIGENFLTLCDAATQQSTEAAEVARAVREIAAGGREHFELQYACHSQEERRWFMVRISRFRGEGAVRVVVAHEDVTARKEVERRIDHQSKHDALTDLPNRKLFLKRLQKCIDARKTDPERKFAVLFFDLDRFKMINDSLGHSIGDKLLLRVAETLRKGIRQSDSVAAGGPSGSVARMGGDEFTILLDHLQKQEDAEQVAQRLGLDLSVPRIIEGHEVFTTASIGIAMSDIRYLHATEMVRDADAAMYHAKSNGKARYAVFNESMHERALGLLQLENDLRHALERKELFLMYQPIVSLRTGKLAGFEALVRWRHPQRGLVQPTEFIPMAEDTGLIVPIGRWVLQTACRQLAEWRKVMLGGHDLIMNINLSRKQLADQGLVEDISEVIRETGLEPGRLKLEITESAVMENGNADETLARIKRTGVRLYLDDFGTGQSSLSCLHRFPLEGLKIDRHFVAEASGRRDHGALIQAVITLARNLGMQVVAEGLETTEQVAMLQGLECDLGQGYYFARPLTAEAAAAYAREISPLQIEFAQAV